MSELNGQAAVENPPSEEDGASTGTGAEEQHRSTRRRSRRTGGLPADLSLVATREYPEESDDDDTPPPEEKPRRQVRSEPSEEPSEPSEPSEPPEKPGDGAEKPGDGAEKPDDGEETHPPAEIADDHVFEVETDEELGPEPWTLKELKEAAKLTEEAVKWKNLGEQAVEQRNRLVQDIRDNPMQTMYRVGVALFGDERNARAWLVKAATSLVNENIEYEEMDPTNRQLMELQRQNEQLQRQLQARQEGEEQATQNREKLENFERTRNEVVSAVTALGREADDETVEFILERLDQAHMAGHTYITASQAARVAIEELDKAEEERWRNLDPERLPPEVLDRIRKFEVERMKKETRPSTPASSRSAPSEPTRRRSRRVAGLRFD